MSDSAAPRTVARHTPWDFPGKSVIYEDSNSLFSFPALCSSLSCCATSPRSRPHGAPRAHILACSWPHARLQGQPGNSSSRPVPWSGSTVHLCPACPHPSPTLSGPPTGKGGGTHRSCVTQRNAGKGLIIFKFDLSVLYHFCSSVAFSY